MKIAIYGDSFGCINTEKIADDKNHSWPHLLRQQLGVSFLANYSVVGNSFISSYNEYLNNKYFYDVNIFLVTKIGRIDFPQLKGICRTVFHNATDVYFTRNYVNEISPETSTDEQKILANKLFDYADLYFDVGQNLYYEEISRRAIISHAMTFPEYTIFIPCFETGIIPNSDTPLIDIFDFENECLGINKIEGNEHFGSIINGRFTNDLRQCHLTKDNNKLMLDKIVQAVKSGSKTIDLQVRDFVVPTCAPTDCYEWITIS